MAEKKKYTVMVFWEMAGCYEDVEADCIEGAIDLIKDEPLPDNASYVEDSFSIDRDGTEDWND